MSIWVVVYRVKYSERWCADECNWVEHDEVVAAPSRFKAMRIVRHGLERLPRCIVGRHISTRRLR